MRAQTVLGPIVLALLAMACGNDPTKSDTAASSEATKPTPERLLRPVPSDSSGVHFTNALTETVVLNYYTYEYMYNGGGVAAGDVNGDGLTDLYFTANMSGDRLYLNRGGLRFEDITDKAIAAADSGWHTGVTMADVNNDGRLDIYVCRAGRSADPRARTNLYYENKGSNAEGIPTFTERAAELGIDDTTRSTQGVFFDHDADGDLDLYVINCPLQGKSQLNSKQIEDLVKGRKAPTSRLYRNDGTRFTDITTEAGLWTMGYSLGVSVTDLDGDGRQDIYVAND